MLVELLEAGAEKTITIRSPTVTKASAGAVEISEPGDTIVLACNASRIRSWKTT